MSEEGLYWYLEEGERERWLLVRVAVRFLFNDERKSSQVREWASVLVEDLEGDLVKVRLGVVNHVPVHLVNLQIDEHV